MKLKLHFIPLILQLISGSLASAPLSGVYTIGGASPSYPTFAAALNALTTNGVNGPVTFNVRAGTYNEQVSISAITGASASNRVTFQSATGLATDVTLVYASTTPTNNYIINLNGANYVTFKNLTLTNTGPLQVSEEYQSQGYYFGYLVDFGNIVVLTGSNNDSLVGNIMNLVVTKDTFGEGEQIYQCWGIELSGTCDSLVIAGNQINNGVLGFLAENYDVPLSNGVVVENNTFKNQFQGSIYINYLNNVLIQGNTIVDTLVVDQGVGIYLTTNLPQMRVLSNKIYTAQFAIAELNCVSVAGREGLVADNFLSSTYPGTIEVVESSHQFIYYNSAVSTYGGFNSNAVFEAQEDTAITLMNNIFYNARGGEVISTDANSINASDYNDFYTYADSMGAFGQWFNYQHNLAGWQLASGFDAHSNFIKPPFVSSTDFHLTDYDLMRFGMPLASVPDDIDGHIRSLVVTDVGASESPLSVAFTASATTICAGSTVTFTDQTPNHPTAWSWTFSGGIPGNSNSQDPVVTYDTAGSFSVKLVVTDSLGTDSLIKAAYITVNAAPAIGAVTVSNNTICAGDSSQLVVTGSAGAIQWQAAIPPDTFNVITGADSLTYKTGVLSQSTDYRWIVRQGACTDTSAPVTITVNPVPDVPVLFTADSTICSSDSARIQATAGYTSYHWNNGDTTGYTWVNSAGGYWVTVTNASGCQAVSGHQDISVYPVPSVSIIVQGDTLSSFGVNSYQWYLDGDSIPNATSAIYIVTQSGNYSVGVTDTNGCRAVSSSTYVAITGISQLTARGSLSIYPNPFTNTIFIKDNEAGTVIQNVKIYDVLGRMVLSNQYGNSAPLILPVDVSVLPTGAYCIKVETNQSEQTLSIIKN